MILSAHQPNYLPYLGFFDKVARSQIFVILDTAQYVKGGPFGWINRNKIRTKDGSLWLTVPVLTKGKFTQSIIDVKINNKTNWEEKHLKSLTQNYNKAPYFKKYFDFLQDVYNKNWEKLADLNIYLIMHIIKQLGIQTKIMKSSQLDLKTKGTQLLVDLCQYFGTDTYLSGIHGRDYLNAGLFNENNINLIFQDFKHPVYKQQYKDFVPNLSIIDLFLNCGPESAEVMNEYLV